MPGNAPSVVTDESPLFAELRRSGRQPSSTTQLLTALCDITGMPRNMLNLTLLPYHTSLALIDSKSEETSLPLHAAAQSVNIDLSQIKLRLPPGYFWNISLHDYITREIEKIREEGKTQIAFANRVAAEQGLVAELTPVAVFHKPDTTFHMSMSTPDSKASMFNMNMVMEETDKPGVYKVVQQLNLQEIPKDTAHEIRVTKMNFTHTLAAGKQKGAINNLGKRKYVLTAPIHLDVSNYLTIPFEFPDGSKHEFRVSSQYTVNNILFYFQQKIGPQFPNQHFVNLKDARGVVLAHDKTLAYYDFKSGSTFTLKVELEPVPELRIPVKNTRIPVKKTADTYRSTYCPSLELHVVTGWDTAFTLRLNSNTLFEEVRRQIAAREPVEVNDLRIMIGSRIVNDKRSLADENVSSGAILRVAKKRGRFPPLPQPLTLPNGNYILGDIKITAITSSIIQPDNASSDIKQQIDTILQKTDADHIVQLKNLKQYQPKESLAEVRCHFERMVPVGDKHSSISFTRYPERDIYCVYKGDEIAFINDEFRRADQLIDSAANIDAKKSVCKQQLQNLKQFILQSLPKLDDKQIADSKSDKSAVTTSQKVQAGLMLAKLFVELMENKLRVVPYEIKQNITAVLKQCPDLNNIFDEMLKVAPLLQESRLNEPVISTLKPPAPAEEKTANQKQSSLLGFASAISGGGIVGKLIAAVTQSSPLHQAGDQKKAATSHVSSTSTQTSSVALVEFPNKLSPS